MKKISSKNISKSPKKRKKRRISIYGDELEEEIKPLFEINKDLVFSNIAEIIATNIVEKIILNAFVEIRKKNLYSLMGIQCSNYLLKEIHSLLSLSYICYEKENYFPSELEFNDNYLRYEIPLEEFDIPQPTAPLLDRWKVHRVNIIKHKHNTNQKNHERRKSREKTTNKSSKRKSELKDNNSNNNKNSDENNLKLETKINKNREKLFNTKNDKNEILKEQKEKKIILLKNKDKKLYNSNENVIEKKEEVEPSNNTDNKNKEEINKDKLINFKKSINPITINIDLADDNNSNIINEKLPEKILLSSDRISPDNKERIKFHHKIQRKKLENKKILIDDKIKEKKEIKENTSIKKDNTEKPRKKVSKIREYNIETFTPNESRDIKKRKIINNTNNILLNTIETNILGKKAINKILGNNHYKALFTDIYGVDREKETNTKKKFKFSERKKDKTNKGFNIRLTESSESYYDLYKKAFNDTSIEQKFSFKPKINKKYFNSEYSNTNEFYDENNKTYDNTKKISSLSFNSKREKSLKDFDEFDNNKNDILDLNHFIPIDENKLIYTFNKPLFGDKNKN